MSQTERVCSNLATALDELRGAGFRLDSIYPADNPHSAVLTRGSETVRITTQPGASPPGAMPPLVPEFILTRAGAEGGEGRAGMGYRDLIPDRLGGRYIASHITIAEGGPVADWVHYHRVALQLIAVRRGWARVVYQDQGEPFVMGAGDVVLQPPGIRHRVIESSAGLEVVEISAPALHETLADHDLDLPNRENLGHGFGGQDFVHHYADTPWIAFNGGEAQETAIHSATSGLADVRFVRSLASTPIRFLPHDGELIFGFVLEGSARLEFSGDHALGAADSFVIPPGAAWTLCDPSPDFRLLHVTTSRLRPI